MLRRFDNADNFIRRLEKANIIIDTALRFGTCEVTRKGMKEHEMRYIAELVAQIYDIKDTKYFKTRILKVRKEIEDLALRYSKIGFSFDSL